MKVTKLTLFIMSFISYNLIGQVGINEPNPDFDSDLTLGSTNKGLRLNRVNLTSTTDAISIGEFKPEKAGLIVYNTSTTQDVTPGIYVNDGIKWNRIMDMNNQSRNEGVVRINGYFLPNGNETKPTFNNTIAGQHYQILYPGQLSLAAEPTTSWPENNNQIDDNIYRNNQFIENPVIGQVHQWRIVVSYKKIAQLEARSLTCVLRNPHSNFRLETSEVIPSEREDGTIIFNITTVADTKSIPFPIGERNANGYALDLFGTTSFTTITIENITRISHYKD